MQPALDRPLSDHAPELLQALAREASAHPLVRKLVVAPAAGAGRELMRSLARLRGGWTGFDVTTVRPLAVVCATEWIAAEGVRVLDGFEEDARLDEALDEALHEPPHREAFGELGEGVGFRRAARDALKALRLNGVRPDAVSGGRFENPVKQSFLASALRHYEDRLRADRAADVAGVLERAAGALDRGARLPAGRILLLPGLGLRGRAGRFVRALQARGAVALATDPVVGLDPPAGMLWTPGPVRSELSRLYAAPAPPAERNAPAEPPTPTPTSTSTPTPAPAPTSTPAPAPDPAPPSDDLGGLPLFDLAPATPPVPMMKAAESVVRFEPASAYAPATPDLHLFRAAGVHEELREVLRRVVAGGHRWEEVEIATPDAGVYGPTLHTLCSRLGVETTFAVGLPVSRTRPGRAVAAWFRWIAEDGPSPILRRLLQSADLVAPGRRPADSPWLARTLRGLRVGWGRHRYRPLIAAALDRARASDPAAPRHLSPEAAAERRSRTIRDLESLDRLLRAILDSAPDPTRDSSPGAVASGLAAFLRLVSAESEVDRSALERLLRTLERIEATLRRSTRFSTAIATVREHLEIRVPAPRAEGRAPWLSDGGAVHLSDLEHAGLSGRPLLFVVGMDSGRFPGGDRQDPFLLDRERASLHPDLPLTEHRVAEAEFRFASLLARARGTVTVSYPSWDAAEARTLQPSAVVLSLFRLAQGDSTLGYGDLARHLDAPASRVPHGATALDADDVWLDAIALEGRFLDGRSALRSRYVALDRGLDAVEAPLRAEAGPRVGIVGTDGVEVARIDPRSDRGPVLSASGLEQLGTCPLRYFYSRVLRIRPPDDPEFDLERWLTPADRGVLLHDVYQDAVDAARESALDFASDDFRRAALECLARRVRRMKAELPPPGDAVFRAEVSQLEADVRSFCAHLAAGPLTPDQVVATELELGRDEPARLPLPDGSALRVRGRIDRVDDLGDGRRVVDYKTGSAWGHGPKDGVYRGGRRLQHVVYARTVEAQSPDQPPVTSAGYHFLTVRGQNQTFDYPDERLRDGLDLVATLVDLPAAARFPATDDPDDCRYCDYASVCRHGAVEDDDGRPSTPRVEWTRARMADGNPAVAELAAARRSDA